MRWLAASVWLALIGVSCSGQDDSPTPPPGDVDAGTTEPPDGSPGDAEPELDGDPPPDGSTPDGSTPLVFETVRAITHAHSIWSHDGCAGDGYPYGSPESLECLAQMREAPCSLGIDLLALTDHPSNMQEQDFIDALHHDAAAGDELVLEGDEPIANRVFCPGGHSYLIMAGYEDEHSMPLGLHHPLPSPEDYEGITDATPIGTVQARVAAMEAAGAVPAVVHSEKDDISAATIRDGGFAAMEWYNIHANIEALIGDEYLVSGDYQSVINSLKTLDGFLLGSGSGAHPDLVYLAMLPLAPTEGYDTWATVNRDRAITGILGTDVHRNVEVDAGICDGGMATLCSIAAALYPNVLSLLVAGGTIVLTDGEQIDAYRRTMSWLENRLLVDEATPLAIADALRSGRSYGLFTVFGEPDRLVFEAESEAGRVAMGSSVSGSATLQVELPSRPVALAGYVPFTEAEADAAEIRATLVRTDASGSTSVRESTSSFAEEIGEAGAYHLEIRIRPGHLAPHLGSESALAEPEFLWIITNPIRVVP